MRRFVLSALVTAAALPAASAQTPPAQQADQPQLRFHPVTRADMAAIRAPTLLVGGADTPLLFPPILDALERGIAGAERVDLPGTTHLMSDEDPAAFNAAVLGFLGGRT